AEDGIRDLIGTGVQTCALPILKLSDEDLALARSVELAEEDALPLAERKLAVAQRDEDLRARQRRADVRRRVRAVGIFDMLPVPAVVDDPLHGVLEVFGD